MVKNGTAELTTPAPVVDWAKVPLARRITNSKTTMDMRFIMDYFALKIWTSKIE
jgi:hypothetical protein